MLKIYLKCVFLLFMWTFSFGFAGPFLISYPDTLLVIAGFSLLLFIVVPLSVKMIYDIKLDLYYINRERDRKEREEETMRLMNSGVSVSTNFKGVQE